MKSLKNILSKNSNFHSLNDIVQESLRIGINDNPYTASPKSWDELRKIIEQRYKEQGPGTEQEPIDFNDVDVSKINSFYGIHKDTSLNIGIFEQIGFEYIDVSNWNVSNVEDMSDTFCNCYKLKSVGDLSNWDVSNVKIMSWMFSGCEKLESVKGLSKWNVSNVKYMINMFKKSGIINKPTWYKEFNVI